jgi:hypothetical protein
MINIMRPIRSLLLTSVAASCMLCASYVSVNAEEGYGFCVEQDDTCDELVQSHVADASTISNENIKSVKDTSSAEDTGEGYSISVDGEVVAGSVALEDADRRSDVSLATADIQIKFDGLGVKPMLNVVTVPSAKTYAVGETLQFLIDTNYGPWIARADIRIFRHIDGNEMIAQIPVDNQGRAAWEVPEGVEGRLTYVVRVYDQEGRIDETLATTLLPKSFSELSNKDDDGVVPAPSTQTSGASEDRTAIRNIPVYGGAVTVYGRDVDAGSSMYAFGEKVPVDTDGKFVIQRILPPGDHTIQVALRDANDNALDFSRNINIPNNDWFFVGLADLTLGKRFAKNDVKDAYPGEYNGIYNKGRLAFYLKGKMQGRTILTASLDTTEDNFKNILKQIDEKDPRQFLKRIDPDDYYPVYGDDSVTIEDAPTSGRFYVRVDRDDSHVMWGNFKARVSGNKFLPNERALYGAQGVYRSSTASPDGERRTEVSVHAAEPGTLSQQDNLRGTGGSAYFTKFQDVNKGSETITIEERDTVTGFVIGKSSLKAGIDYDFDYSQGVVLLTTPLATNISSHPQFLVINYEYTPATTQVDGLVFGGRAQQWLGNHVRVGASGMRDQSGKSDLDLVGADVRLQAGERSFIDFHSAVSKGKGLGNSTSHDGGLTFSNAGATGLGLRKALAYGVAGQSDLEELTNGRVKGNLGFEYAHKQKDFSTLDSGVLEDRDDARVTANVDVSERTRVTGAASFSMIKGQRAEREVTGAVLRRLTDKTSMEISTKHSSKPGAAVASEVGQRTDFAGKLKYQADEDSSIYIFGQATAHRTGTRKRDDRIGLGGTRPLTEHLKVEAEASIGTYGPDADARLTYTPQSDRSYYIGYALDAYRELDPSSSILSAETDMGTFIFGMKHRQNEQFAVFVEDSYDLFGLRKTLAQTYGVEYTPIPSWVINGALEMGHVYDDTINAGSVLKNSDFDRKALSLSTSYKTDAGDFVRVKSEVRQERSDDSTRDLDSYLLQFQSAVKSFKDWRLLLNADVLFSNSSATARDGEYVEASIGHAYRPVDNDRLNALFKYTYLYDLPGADQVTVNGTLNGPQQQSHILSADMIYDLNPILSVGAKYGMRYGETRDRSGTSSWTRSVAHLGIVHADINIYRQWDALLEGRILWSPTGKSSNLGALAAVYRQMGENFKVGVGYNFGQFSDDLRDLTLDDHGIFINAVGKF